MRKQSINQPELNEICENKMPTNERTDNHSTIIKRKGNKTPTNW